MAIEWYRAYHGTVNDLKLTVVAKMAGVHRADALAAWFFVLEYASSQQNRGRKRGTVEGIDPDQIAACLEVDTEKASALLQAFESKGMISGEQLAAWYKRQFVPGDQTAADRQRKHRGKIVTPRHGDVTVCHGSVTECHGDTSVTSEKEDLKDKNNRIQISDAVTPLSQHVTACHGDVTEKNRDISVTDRDNPLLDEETGLDLFGEYGWFQQNFLGEIPADTQDAFERSVRTPDELEALKRNLTGYMALPKYREGYGKDAKQFLLSRVWLNPAPEFWTKRQPEVYDIAARLRDEDRRRGNVA